MTLIAYDPETDEILSTSDAVYTLDGITLVCAPAAHAFDLLVRIVNKCTELPLVDDRVFVPSDLVLEDDLPRVEGFIRSHQGLARKFVYESGHFLASTECGFTVFGDAADLMVELLESRLSVRELFNMAALEDSNFDRPQTVIC